MSKRVQHVQVCDWCGAQEGEHESVLTHGDSCTITPDRLPPFWVRVHYTCPANPDAPVRDACTSCAERLGLYSQLTLDLLESRRERRRAIAEADRELDKMT